MCGICGILNAADKGEISEAKQGFGVPACGWYLEKRGAEAKDFTLDCCGATRALFPGEASS